MTTHVALAAARSTPRELHRVRSDASLALQPASSFASLRSSNRNLMRGESMTGAEHRPVTHSIDETRAMAGPDSVRKRHSPKVLARKPSVHPVMMKRFPALRSAGARAMEPPPSGTWDGLDGADADLGGGSGGGYGGASSPQSRRSRGSRGSRGSRRSRRSSTGMRKSASAASTRSSRRVRSSTRLYDRALTASSMDSINWLPRFRKAIAISHAKNPLPGAAAALAMTGTLRTIKRTRTKEQRAESAAALANVLMIVDCDTHTARAPLFQLHKLSLTRRMHPMPYVYATHTLSHRGAPSDPAGSRPSTRLHQTTTASPLLAHPTMRCIA